jgi:hypothetical protein
MRLWVSKDNNKIKVRQGYKTKILFNCTYLQIIISVHAYEEGSVKTNMPYVLTYLLTYLLTELSPSLGARIVQPLKNPPAFYGTRRFNTVFTRALQWSLS